MEPIATSAAARTPQVIELATEETIVYELTWRIRIKPGKRRILRRLTPQLQPKKTTSVPKERPIAKVLPAIRERKRSASRENDLKRETLEEILKPQVYDEILAAPVLVYTCTVEKDTENKEGTETEQSRQGDGIEENAHGNIDETNKESPVNENKEQGDTASENLLGLKREETVCENKREEGIGETAHPPKYITASENKPPVNEEKDNFNQENKSSEYEEQDSSNQVNESVNTEQDNPNHENEEQDHSSQVNNSSEDKENHFTQENRERESPYQENKSQVSQEQESSGQEVNLLQESPPRDEDKSRGWTDPCTSHRDWERKLVFLLEKQRKASQRKAPGNMECVNGEGCHIESTEIEDHRKKETSITDCLEEFLKGLHLTHLLDYLKVLGCMCVRDLRLLEMPELEAIQLISRRRLLQQLDTLSLHHEAPPEGCSLEAWLTWYGLTHISGFLTAIGVHSVGDLGYLKEEDLLLLKPVTRRRILACHKKISEKRRMLSNGLIENDYLM